MRTVPRIHAVRRVLPRIAMWGVAALVALLFAFIVSMLLPASAAAQLAPDAPRLISPHAAGGFGVYQLRGTALPGSGNAVLATWAMRGLPGGVRWRAAAGTGAEGNTAYLLGADVQTPLLRRTADGSRRLDLDWQSGIGVSTGAYTLLTMPVGVSAGLSWSSGSVWLAPYANAGIAADLRLGDDAPSQEFAVTPAFDVGLDLAFDREREIVLRAAAALGKRKGVTVGFAVGAGRR